MIATPLRERRWAVMISGRGSNLQALLDCAGESPVRWVLSSREDAPGLRRARRAGVATSVLPKKIDWTALDGDLCRRGITNLFLCGFMKLVPGDFVEKWAGRIVNVHPSLLPAYPGLKSFERAFEENAAGGATVHVVTPEMDAGPRLLQTTVVPAKARLNGATLENALYRLSFGEQRLVREALLKWRA